MTVAIINYGMGNLGSVAQAFDDLGAPAKIAEHPAMLFEAQRIVLPGVGAFGEGMARLRDGGWAEALSRLVEDGRPLLGICLGMQMLAQVGEEGRLCEGLGFISGRVRRLDALGCTLRVPHVGWNDVDYVSGGPLFEHIPPRSDFYFVHSYAVSEVSPEELSATVDYDVPLVAAVRRGNVFGAQFHPEKSSKVGRQLLRNFLVYEPCLKYA
jgi:glutamine amidotransferase